ncbi:MAG: hypothetical protein WDW36_009184 [Sanguina aurantia]
MDKLRHLFVKTCADFAVAPAQALVDDLSGSELLTTLRLNGNSKRLFKNRIQVLQVFALAESLQEDSTITSLDLSYNFLNDMAAQALAGLLKVNKNILRLDLTGNDITATGAAHLTDALLQPGCSLEQLLLGGNPLGDAGILAIADMLKVNRALRELHLANTRCGLTGIVGLSTALSDTENGGCGVRVLDMEAPMLGGPQELATQHLARMLAENTTITHLGLQKHGLVDSTLATLIDYGLLRNRSLQSLDLRANRLSPFAAPHLERLLADKPTLSTLRLSHNALGDEVALMLSRSLPYTHWLTELDLRSNNIGSR